MTLSKKIYSLLILCFYLLACNEVTKKEMGNTKAQVKQTQDVISSSKTIADNADELQTHILKLKETAPIEPQALKNWLPETLGNFKRSKFALGKRGYAGVSAISGTYTNGLKGKVKQSVNIELMDGAGETGSIMASSMLLASHIVHEREDEREHVKQIEHNGIHATQKYKKQSQTTTLNFVIENRYAVYIRTTKMFPEETWEYVDELDFSKLPGEPN